MTLRSMWTVMEELYHGNGDKKIISQVDQLCNSRPPYTDLFEKRMDLMTGPCGATQISCSVLKSDICRTEINVILGRDITKSVLEQTSFKKNSQLITGKTLVRLAQDSLKNIKKALALISTLDAVQSFTSADGITCKSGRTLLDVQEQLLDKMHELLQGKMSAFDVDTDNDNQQQFEGRRLSTDGIMSMPSIELLIVHY